MSKTMLYKLGTMITCGRFNLDYVIIDDGEVDSHLASGWKIRPDDTEPAEPERKKPGRKPKAVDDGENKG